MTGATSRPSLSEAELDGLMERIRTEIAARKAKRGAAPSSAEPHIAADEAAKLPRFEASPPLERKPDYSLDDFLRYHDEEFVRHAYRRILGREPDRAGADVYLRLLRSGEMGKADALAALRFSAEGRARGVTVQGLSASRVTARRLRRLPVVGYLIDLVGGLIRLPRYVQALRRTESFAAANHQQVRHVVDSLARSVEEKLSTLRAALNAVDSRLAASELAIGETRETIQGAGGVQDQLRETQRDLAACRIALVQVERAHVARPMTAEAQALHPTGQVNEAAGFDRFYADFEDRFRGTREDIANRQKVYLPFLSAQPDEPHGTLPAIDIGCGRGEWLELLGAAGIRALGVDTNRTFLEGNRARGLHVVEADALEYLAGLAEGSTRAITGFHIIEHLPFGRLVELVDESLRVLADGGLAIFETPNPENLVTAACNFYYDPTHIRPIPPDLAAHLLKVRGFSRVEILRLHEAQIPEVESIESPTLRRLLFGPQDYAVVGFK